MGKPYVGASSCFSRQLNEAMKRLLFATLACLFALPAAAQIEMDNSGAVGVGTSPQSDPLLRTELGVVVYGFGNHALTTAVYAQAGGASTLNQGVFAVATGSSGTDAYGVITLAGSGDTNYGMYTSASAPPGATAYGIYATTDGPGTRYAGYFNGDVTITGTLNNPSDLLFKEDVVDFGTNGEEESVLTRVLRLRPVSYTYRLQDFSTMQLPEGRQFGLIAQDVESLFPELVSDQVHPAERNESGEIVTEAIEYKALNYLQLIPILVQAIQDQQAEIEELRALLNQHSH